MDSLARLKTKSTVVFRGSAILEFPKHTCPNNSRCFLPILPFIILNLSLITLSIPLIKPPSDEPAGLHLRHLYLATHHHWLLHLLFPLPASHLPPRTLHPTQNKLYFFILFPTFILSFSLFCYCYFRATFTPPGTPPDNIVHLKPLRTSCTSISTPYSREPRRKMRSKG